MCIYFESCKVYSSNKNIFKDAMMQVTFTHLDALRKLDREIQPCRLKIKDSDFARKCEVHV